MIDSNLTKQLKNGNEDAYASLFKVTYPRMISYCKLFVYETSIADDLVQDCFIKLWNQRHKLNPDKSVESFLFVMLRNHCLNYLREQKLGNQELKLDGESWNEIQHLYQIDFLGKEERTLESMMVEALEKAIDELPTKRKEIFIRCKINGEKQKAVAQDLGVTTKNIEKHIRLAKDELYEKLSVQFPVLSSLIAFILYN